MGWKWVGAEAKVKANKACGTCGMPLANNGKCPFCDKR